MAYFSMKLKSQALAGPATVRLYLPTDSPSFAGEIKGVVTLLHGHTNDGDDWVQKTSALRYAEDNQLALVIPDAGNSFYCDMAAGPAYYTWLTQELPGLLQAMVKLPAQREKNAVFGLSMGGYGALLLGLSCPQRYFACASFSGAVDVGMMLEVGSARPELYPVLKAVFGPVFGPELKLPPERSLYQLARAAADLEKEQKPQVLCTVGRQDHEPYYIYNQNLLFRDFVQGLALDYTYEEWDGAHEWSFWDRSLALAIDRFFNPGYAAQKQGDWTAR